MICTLHGAPDLSGSSLRRTAKLRILGRRRNRVVVVSHSLGEVVRAAGGVPSEILRVVHNGVDMADPRLTGDERKELGAGPDDFLVGAVGNIRPAKDYANLLHAAAVVRDAGCPIRVVVLGEGGNALEGDLLELRRDLRLEGEVAFLGFRPDPRRLLAAVDVFVSSSLTEGFSLSTVEALSAGRPVIATRSGGPEEIIRDSITGQLVPVSRPDLLGEAILRVYRDPKGAAEMGRSGRDDVRRRFSRDAMIEAYESLYTEVTCTA